MMAKWNGPVEAYYFIESKVKNCIITFCIKTKLLRTLHFGQSVVHGCECEENVCKRDFVCGNFKLLPRYVLVATIMFVPDGVLLFVVCAHRYRKETIGPRPERSQKKCQNLRKSISPRD